MVLVVHLDLGLPGFFVTIIDDMLVPVYLANLYLKQAIFLINIHS